VENNHLLTPVITPEILNMVSAIDEFKGRWDALGMLAPTRLKALRRVAAMESAAAAGRLSGVRCSDRQVGEYLTGWSKDTDQLPVAAQQIISAYYSVLKMVNNSYEQILFNVNHVNQLHDLMLSHNLTRKLDLTPLPDKAIDQVNNTIILIEENRLHPLLITADFSCHFWNLLQPLQRVSARLTWLLIKLLLLRKGYSFLAFGSLEHFLEKKLPDYRKSLLAHETNSEGGLDLPWLMIFLESILDLRDNLTAKINREKELMKISEPLREITRVVQEHGQSTISRIMEATGMNRNTLKIRLRKLVAEQYLVQHGHGKSSYYTLQEFHLK